MELIEARRKIRQLIDENSPDDAPTAYYALFHAPERSALFTRQDNQGRLLGFVGRFQTGVDLFRPLITLKCSSPEGAAELLEKALTLGRPYILFSSLNQLAMVGGSMQMENQRILRIYAVEPSRFKPEMNVLVVHKNTASGLPRCEIQDATGKPSAVAGVNWKSPAFAEIYVHTEPQARQKGHGRTVVAALTQRLLAEGVRPVYLVEGNNIPSVQLVESLGYVDTGSRQVYAETIYKGHRKFSV